MWCPPIGGCTAANCSTEIDVLARFSRTFAPIPFASRVGRSISATGRSITAAGIKPLSSLFGQSDRLKNLKTGRHIVRTATFAPRLEQQDKERRRSTMKKFGFTTVVGSALIAGALGFAGLAQADTGHNDWVH